MKIACASPQYPKDLEDGIVQIDTMAKNASEQGAEIICFPESFLPGYPLQAHLRIFPKEELNQSLTSVQTIAKKYAIAILLPMDAYIGENIFNAVYVLDKNGDLLGYQTKNQLDPSEDEFWTPGTERYIFEINQLKFGISICHEGFRYPETVRWAACQGAHIVFHPFFAGVLDNGHLLKEWAQTDSPYYEKAQMVRAIENGIYFATSNYAFPYPEAASSIIDPDGHCITYQPYGTSGIIVADIDLSKANGLYAKRLKSITNSTIHA